MEKEATAALTDIETLREKNRILEEVFEGVKAANHWKSGRQMEEKEFLAAVTAFKQAPADGRDREAKG